MLTFFNTRPTQRAQPLTHHLSTRGIRTISMPLLQLIEHHLGDDTPTQEQIHRLLAHAYDALVVVSPMAGRLGLSHCPYSFVPTCPVVAVGDATAAVLRQAGWQVFCPNQSSNEGMLCMPELQRLNASHRVLIWRGHGGRRLLIDDLKQRGVVVDSTAWYDRRCPPNLSDVLHNQLSALDVNIKKPVVLISSGQAWQCWQCALPLQAKNKYWRVHDCYYLVLGDRLARLLTAHHLAHTQLHSLQPDHVFSTLQTLWNSL